MTEPAPDDTPIVVTTPGLYPDMPEDAYHGDPVPGGSLSASDSKLLLSPSCPALFQHRKAHPAAKPALTFGSAAHHEVLGVGPRIVEVEYDSWRTKDARRQQVDAIAAGELPLLTHELAQVRAMATVLREHPKAGYWLDPTRCAVEQSIFWQELGVWRRGRLDSIHDGDAWQPPVVVDYKTTTKVDPESLSKVMNDFRYHLSGATYLAAMRSLGHGDARFVLVCQMKDPPYLITVAEPTAAAIRIGDHLAQQAISIYLRCRETGQWPGYGDDAIPLDLPRWAYRDLEHHTTTGDTDLWEFSA